MEDGQEYVDSQETEMQKPKLSAATLEFREESKRARQTRRQFKTARKLERRRLRKCHWKTRGTSTFRT